MPQVIIIDEIGTELEVLAARTIAEKGVQLVGTTHGNCLENLIKNPPLADLIGGIQYVTLSDDEAKRRGTQKSILERKAYPAFEIIIEVNNQKYWTIYEDVSRSVDLFLRNNFKMGQIRQFSITDKVFITSKQFQLPKNHKGLLSSITFSNDNWAFINQRQDNKLLKANSKKLIIYPYSLSNNLLKEILIKMELKFILTNEIRKANVIIGLKKHLKQNFRLIKLAKQKEIPIYSLNQVSFYQVNKMISFLY